MEKVLNIVFITDLKYQAITATAIYSLKENKNKLTKYNIFVIMNYNDETAKFRYLEMQDKNFNIVIKRYEDKNNNFIKVGYYVSTAAIIKFYIPEILWDLDKVLYLDSDILVTKDLEDLYSFDIENYYAAVVEDIKAEHTIPSIIHKLKCNLKKYFNSGMMLLNLNKMRNDGISEKLLNYRENCVNYFMDQDAFNIVFNESVKYISFHFNYIPVIDLEFSNDIIIETWYKELPNTQIERLNKAYIIHMSGIDKPWNQYFAFVTELFMQYYKKTPWGNDNLYNPKKNNILCDHYLFPFDLITKGCNIALYGGGKVGEVFFEQISFSKYCNIIVWVDEEYEEYMKIGKKLKDPKELLMKNYDFIVLAVKNEDIKNNIIDKLINMNIAEQKIIWKYPVINM